ncbi:MAG: adenylate/guanylate cyclase domain-containing protein [Candidatus Promineifilaceae bacterium]|nr:adenylate/guanylate cyclase domain-containing protein [Candidatus Promineifilaceae bacterium]
MRESPLALLERRLRLLLPARLYARAWVNPSVDNLTAVFSHLRTLQYILHDYVPQQVLEQRPTPGEVSYRWAEGALMFTDLAGFTTLLDANAPDSQEGALRLLDLLNSYFASMIEIITKSGGTLLEFTGDALLALFPEARQGNAVERGVRAGLRMQRAMSQFAQIETRAGTFALKMRVGLHTGRFVMADIGTPRRMEHVLLGQQVYQAKLAESAGRVDRVNLTPDAYEAVVDEFRFEPGQDGHMLVLDDLSERDLGDYEIIGIRRRRATPLLLDRSEDGLMEVIADTLDLVEPLASYLPPPVLNLLVENATMRRIPPDFPTPLVMFVSLLGLPEAVDAATPEETERIVATFSRTFALINAVVEARGAVLKKVTYHLSGSDIVIYFGVPNAHTDEPLRAASAALAIRDVVQHIHPPLLGGKPLTLSCKIGINSGFTFVGEIGEPRGRREYNVLGDTVNIAARLMNRAQANEILISGSVADALAERFNCVFQGTVSLKGKQEPTRIYNLVGEQPERARQRPPEAREATAGR